MRDRSWRMQMRIVRQSLAVLLAALLVAPAAQAQTYVINKSALSQAVQERVSQDQSLQKAEAAVSTLNGADLRDLATQSRQAQNDLAGGASNIVISTTTLIIVLLIIILIVLIAD